MSALILNHSRAKAYLRNLALRMTPERVFERSLRRFFDAERPLVEVPATG